MEAERKRQEAIQRIRATHRSVNEDQVIVVSPANPQSRTEEESIEAAINAVKPTAAMAFSTEDWNKLGTTSGGGGANPPTHATAATPTKKSENEGYVPPVSTEIKSQVVAGGLYYPPAPAPAKKEDDSFTPQVSTEVRSQVVTGGLYYPPAPAASKRSTSPVASSVVTPSSASSVVRGTSPAWRSPSPARKATIPHHPPPPSTRLQRSPSPAVGASNISHYTTTTSSSSSSSFSSPAQGHHSDDAESSSSASHHNITAGKVAEVFTEGARSAASTIKSAAATTFTTVVSGIKKLPTLVKGDDEHGAESSASSGAPKYGGGTAVAGGTDYGSSKAAGHKSKFHFPKIKGIHTSPKKATQSHQSGVKFSGGISK